MTRGILRGFAIPAAVLNLMLSATLPGLAAQDTLATQDTLAAQDTLPRLRPAMGGSVERFIYEGQGITAVSFHYSGLKPNTLSTEIAAALFPDALDVGALVLAPDFGAAYDARGTGFDLLLKAGISTLMAVGGGFAFQPGYHFGSGLLIRTGKASGVRLDVVRHAYLIDQETEGIWSVGIGFTSLPAVRRSDGQTVIAEGLASIPLPAYPLTRLPSYPLTVRAAAAAPGEPRPPAATPAGRR